MKLAIFCVKQPKIIKKYMQPAESGEKELTKGEVGDIIIKLSNERGGRERVKKFFRKRT